MGNLNVLAENSGESIYGKFKLFDKHVTEPNPFNPTGKLDKNYLSLFPQIDDLFCSLHAVRKLPKAVVKETQRVITHARRFNEEVARPLVMKEELKTYIDHDHLAWTLTKKANEWGFYSLGIPKAFSGQGLNMSSVSYAVEELSSVCVGLANIAFVHYLGAITALASWNAPLLSRIFKDVSAGEKSGNPCTLSLAITEPSAGTDTEETALLDKGKITCLAQQVQGGFIVNGNKIFISMGHMATWHILVAYTDVKNSPSENMITMAIKTGTKGFTFGKHEDKMGQRVCCASELIFEDCFVPDDQVLFYGNAKSPTKDRSKKQLASQVIHYVLQVTRAAVGAFGTGVARGAYETALKYANETMVDGKLLINHEWAQVMLAEMYRNYIWGRLTYLEANYSNSMPGGIFENLQFKPIFYYLKYAPKVVYDWIVLPIINTKLASSILELTYSKRQKPEQEKRGLGWSSIAKTTGSDMGLKNSQMALELMGMAGLRFENGAEKYLRDSKLLQIYEGTNQLNLLNVFSGHIAKLVPEARVFEE
jgi:alkylation response protein AidB-like acyl-CoA dehydrogenase